MNSLSKKIKITCKCSDSLPIDQLKAFQGKLKTIDEESFNKLKASILKYGFSFPIFIWNKNILDGHQRFYAVQRLIGEGYELKDNALPVVWIEAKNAREAAEKLLLCNSRYAKIDQQGFEIFIEDYDIKLEDIDIVLDIPEIDLGLGKAEDYEGLTDPDEIPEVEEEPITKPGDIWILGDHRLMCGDSTKIEDVEKLMDGQKADMVFTDPPYGIDLETDYTKKYSKSKLGDGRNTRSAIYKKIENDNINFDASFILEYFKNVKEIFLWGANNFIDSIENSINGSWICWDKKNSKELYKVISSDFELAWSKNKHKYTMFKITWCGPFGHNKKNDTEKKIHPTQKPVKLIIEIFNKFWCKDLNLVVDLYLGSGSTLIAAQQTGRKCFAMEIDPHYVDVAVKRWEDFTGEKAELLT